MASKTELREVLAKKKGVEGDPQDYDITRIIPKREGGTFTEENLDLIDPVEWMKAQNIFVKREPNYENMKVLYDERHQVQKLRVKIGNQLKAIHRHVDEANPQLIDYLEDLKVHVFCREKLLTTNLVGVVHALAETDLTMASALGVHAIGEVTVAGLRSYIRPEKIKHVSSIVKYLGLHVPANQRYTKGKASGGNKNLRTTVFTSAISQIRARGPYRVFYDDRKARYQVSEREVLTTLPGGSKVMKPWKDVSDGHRHDGGIRIIMTRLAQDYAIVCCAYAGKRLPDPYVFAILGHDRRSLSPPTDRGWTMP